VVLEHCRVYLIQQFCLAPEYQSHDLSKEPLKQEWLKPIDEVLPVLKVGSTWDSVKLSDCLKLLFREILVPTYGDKFPDFFRGHLFPRFDQLDSSKRSLAHSFELLVLVHAYIQAVFEQS